MSENTKIEWENHAFNPWEGCQKVGPGCDHCCECSACGGILLRGQFGYVCVAAVTVAP